MKILTRYVLREFLIPLVYCMTGFLSIYVLFDLFGSFSRLMSAKISFKTVVLYFCGYLSPYFHYIVPAALMLATLYTMWSFCRRSEIVAMRASGVSFLVRDGVLRRLGERELRAEEGAVGRADEAREIRPEPAFKG